MSTHHRSTSAFSARLVQNCLASLTVSFVAISLGAAFGLLSGRGAFAGILSAGVIAIITSALGGTRLQCSGPTAPMTAVMATVFAYSTTHLEQRLPGANPDHFMNMVLILTGVFLVAAAALRLGRFIQLVPRVVVSGFMNGIAVLIWVDQFARLGGFAGKKAIGGNPMANIVLAGGSLAIAFFLPRLLGKSMPGLARVVPGALAAIVLGSAAVSVLHLDVELVTVDAKLNSIDALQALFGRHAVSNWSVDLLLVAAPFALNLTMLAYLDTLLTSLVVDKLVLERSGRADKTRQNKELAAQGIANATVALFGGIPGAQATIRCVLLLKENATWRASGILVGVLVLVEMLLLQDFVSHIPQAVFAGILLKVGYDVFDWPPVVAFAKSLRAERQGPWRIAGDAAIPGTVTGQEMFFVAGTTVVTVYLNLNWAVAGFTLLFYVVRRFRELADLGALEVPASAVADEP